MYLHSQYDVEDYELHHYQRQILLVVGSLASLKVGWPQYVTPTGPRRTLTNSSSRYKLNSNKEQQIH